MRFLDDLLKGMEVLRVRGDLHCPIEGIGMDHRTMQAGALFVAIKGQQTDGHVWMREAVAAGAVAVLVQDWEEATIPDCKVVVQLPNTAMALGLLSSAFYGHPSRHLSVVGITGTNGKTSVATMLYQVFTNMGKCCGLISTVSNRIGDRTEPSTHTTPDAVQLQNLLRQMQDQGCTHVFMEVSSHAMVQHRVHGVAFAGGIFTNLTRDHLDYHGSMEKYFLAKRSFFDGLPEQAFALYNADDGYGTEMVACSRARAVAYGFETKETNLPLKGESHPVPLGEDTWYGKALEVRSEGLNFEVEGVKISVPLSGRFNAYNVLAVYAASRLLGEKAEDLLPGMAALRSPQGRMQRVQGPEGRWGLVDYAHTPDALEQVLGTLQEFRSQGTRILTVVGCGGNRDRGKRPQMAQLGQMLSDVLIMTSDNPRHENPEVILDQMSEGLKEDQPSGQGSSLALVMRIADRDLAIRTAVLAALPGDLVLVAGKGHENYQEIEGERHPFNDLERLEHHFQELAANISLTQTC